VPDGYNFLTVIAAHAANQTPYIGKLPYDAVKSFAAVSLVGIAPMTLTVTNSLLVKDVGEFIAYSRAHPGKISCGSPGVGAVAYCVAEAGTRARPSTRSRTRCRPVRCWPRLPAKARKMPG
jgi:tripartite-type tricarboxylate transporter receptor subunit TctC